MSTIVAAAGGGDWNTGSSWVGGIAPTAADDAQVPATAGNMSIGTGAVCRSADFSTYTGILSGTGTLTIGDATAGLSNIALKLVAGMTVSGPPVFSFVSTSATTQSVNFAGKTTGNVTFNGTGGSWQYTGSHVTGSSSQVTLTRGSLDINGQTCSWGVFDSANSNTRSLTLGAAAITILNGGNAWVTSTTTNLTFSGASSTITLSGSSATFNGGGLTYGTVVFSGSGTAVIGSASNTFGTLTVTGPASKTVILQISANQTVTGNLNLNGNSSINRVLIQSSTVGTTRTLTTAGATVAATNADFMDITLSVSKDFSGQTDIGDAGGNSGITFPASATQTYTGGTGNWSDVTKWTSRVPLPQDDVLMSGVTGGTITADMPRMGRSINWTGASGTPLFSKGSTAISVFGSMTLISAMTISGTSTITFGGRSSYTLTSAGIAYTGIVNISAPSGTYTLADAFSNNDQFQVQFGSFVTNNFNLTCLTFQGAFTSTRSLTLGTSTITITNASSSTPWSYGTTTGLTFSGASATILISTTATGTRTFAGGGLTYGTLTYIVAGSTGQLNITGSNTFNTINFSDASNARTLAFTAGTTTTVGTFNVNGTSGKNMTIQSITAATHTLTSSSQQSVDFVTPTNSTVNASPVWYAGANSTDGTGNTNWIFTAPPTATFGASGGSMQSIMNLQNLRSF